MQETKLKIDINQGLLEVEGSEELVREIYSDFKDILKTRPPSVPSSANAMDDSSMTPSDQPSIKVKSSLKAKSKPKPKTKGASDTTGALLKDLNLMNDGSAESLRDFLSLIHI